MTVLQHIPYMTADFLQDALWAFDRKGMAAWIIIPVVLAGLLFYFSKRLHLPLLKWLSFVPLVIGMIIGLKAVMSLGDPLYVQYNLITTPLRLTHIFTLVAPILGIIAISVLDIISKRQSSSRF